MCVTGRRTQILCKISYFSPNMQNYLTLTQLIRGCEKIIITFVAISHTMESTDNRINKNNQGVAGCILKKASDFFQWFYAPVSHTPLLFAIVMFSGLACVSVAKGVDEGVGCMYIYDCGFGGDVPYGTA